MRARALPGVYRVEPLFLFARSSYNSSVNKGRITGANMTRVPASAPRRSDFGASKDRLTEERRSWNMSRIRGKDTTPERVVRSVLHRLGYRFRLHVRIPIEVGTSRCVSRPRPAGVLWRG